MDFQRAFRIAWSENRLVNPLRARNASGPCSRPRDASAKRSRLNVPFLATDPHTKFQRLATNNARGGRPRFRTNNCKYLSVWWSVERNAFDGPVHARVSNPFNFKLLVNKPRKSDFPLQIKLGSQKNRLEMGFREIESKRISKFCGGKSDIEVYLPQA